MNRDLLALFVAAAAIMATLAVAATCVLGLVVWLAGGKVDRRKDQKTA